MVAIITMMFLYCIRNKLGRTYWSNLEKRILSQ